MSISPNADPSIGFSGKLESLIDLHHRRGSLMHVWEADEKHAWITDYHPAGVEAHGAMEEIKLFAYGAFEALDRDSDGFIDRHELEESFKILEPLARERAFVLFMLCHLSEIAAAFKEECITRSDGISRGDLDAYFARFVKAKV